MFFFKHVICDKNNSLKMRIIQKKQEFLIKKTEFIQK
jgi:hypothetical protein